MAVSLQSSQEYQFQMNRLRDEMAAMLAEDESLTKEIANTNGMLSLLESEITTQMSESKALLAVRSTLLLDPEYNPDIDPLRSEINAAASRIENLSNRVLYLKVSAELLEVRNQSLKMRIQTASADMEKIENDLTSLFRNSTQKYG